MRTLALASIWLVAAASSWAQSAPAIVRAAAPRAANAAPYVDAPDARDERLRILSQERDAAQKRLTEAVTALPKAADPTTAMASLARLQGDLIALDREIKSVEAQHSSGAASTAASAPKKPAAPAAGSVTQDSGTSVGGFAAWDVFRNFGQPGHNP